MWQTSSVFTLEEVFLLTHQSEEQGWNWLPGWWLATQLSASLSLPGLGSQAAFLTGGRPRLLQDMALASPLDQPSWTGAHSSRGPGVGHLPVGEDLSFRPFLRPESGVVLICCCPGPVCRD